MIKMMKAGLTLGASLFLFACSDSDDGGADVGQRQQALTAEQNRVLGFETPAADWSSNNGSAISGSSEASEGSQAMAVTLNGYTQISSTTIDAPGSALSTATLDIQVPQPMAWGEARLVAKIPSQGQYWADLGGVSLQGVAPGNFQTFSFNVPSHIQQALNSNATDVSFVVVLNGPSGGGSILVDNLVISDAAGGGEPEEPNSSAVEFSMVVPSGNRVADVMLSGSQKLTIDDRSTLGEPEELTTVASVGPDVTEFGAGVDVYADVISEGNVDFLRSQSHFYGDVTTEGAVVSQDNVVIDGAVNTNTPVSSAVTTWSVDWPEDLASNITLPPDAPNTELPAGGYDQLVAYSRSTLTLRSGAYFFNSLVLEPQVNFNIDASAGPVVIYVKDTLRLNVGINYVGGDEGQTLFGYLGTEAPLFREAIVASVIAPNATIELRRPNSGQPHRGSFFGKGVHVFSDSTVEHIPLDWTFICPLGDRDGDGIFACFDECDLNPEKTEPGFCGCNRPETDKDEDGFPFCIDECDLDPNNTTRGQCGCANETPEAVADAGESCSDGNASGEFVCDGEGGCGDPMDGAPHPDCFPKRFDNHVYWFCPPTSDADGECNASGKGARLAEINNYLENLIIATFQTEPSFIGATDRTQEGEWTWRYTNNLDANKFWTGGQSGQRFNGAYENFRGGAPEDDDGKDCAVINQDGTWDVVDCAEDHPYVCVRPIGILDRPGPGTPIHVERGPGCFYPNWNGEPCDEGGTGGDGDGDGDGDGPDYTICEPFTDGPPSLDHDYGETLLTPKGVQVYDCGSACPEDLSDDDQAACDACQGAALPPEDLNARCEENNNVMTMLSSFASGGLGACGVDVPLTQEQIDAGEIDINEADCSHVPGIFGIPTFCGVKAECLEVTRDGDSPDDAPRGINVPCDPSENEPNSACAAGNYCSPLLGRCVNPDLTEVCDESTRVGEECYGQCFHSVGCGYPVDIEAFYGPDRDIACDETTICPEPPTSSEFENPEQLEEAPMDLASLPNQADAPPPEYSNDFSELCGNGALCTSSCQTEPGPGCDREERHPWCNYEPTLPDGVPTGEDGEAAVRDTREGAAGQGESSALSFNMDPDADLTFNLDPLPFGVPWFDVNAAAGVAAGASFKLGPVKGSVQLLDLRAQLEANLCAVNTKKSRVEILGVDFLPDLARDAYFNTAENSEYSERCQRAVDQYVDAVDRAKKAMRDVQELITQYNNLKENGLTFASDFCSQVAGAGMRPRNMEGWDAANPCIGQTPEETIEDFIEYYRDQVEAIETFKVDLANTAVNGTTIAEALGIEPSQLPRPNNGFELYWELGNVGGDQTTTILSVNFFVGPVPCNLEVSSYMAYGISGGLGASLTPGVVLQQGGGEFVSAGAVVTPFAEAGVTLFVGVGFDAGPLSLKLGIEGAITLANLSIPSTVAAGLELEPQESGQQLPQALTDIAGDIIYPAGTPTRYTFEFTYSYGMSLVLSNILRGQIDAALVVKFAFFKKKWNKKLVEFEGLPPIEIALLNGGSPDPAEWEAQAVADGEQGWKSSYDSVPFVDFNTLIPSTQEEIDAVAALAATEDYQPERAGQLNYDALCTCIDSEAEAEGRTCLLDSECCGDMTCFEDTQGGAPNTCITCRSRFQTCNDTDDCCGTDVCFDDLNSTAPTRCVGCRQENFTCNVDDDCCDGTVCGLNNRCIVPSCGQPCERDEECSGNAFCGNWGSQTSICTIPGASDGPCSQVR